MDWRRDRDISERLADSPFAEAVFQEMDSEGYPDARATILRLVAPGADFKFTEDEQRIFNRFLAGLMVIKDDRKHGRGQ